MEIVTVVDPRILKGLGVRFIFTDQLLKDPHLVLIKEEVLPKEKQNLRLYEISKPNISGFSPTRIVYAQTADESLKILSSKSFEWDQDVIVDKSTFQPLSNAVSHNLRYDKDGIHVDASSPGTSLLVLPLQYSNCLVWNAADIMSSGAKIRRVNLLQAAVEFTFKAKGRITFEFGLGRNTKCRFQDIDDMSLMQLNKLQPKGLYKYR